MANMQVVTMIMLSRKRHVPTRRTRMTTMKRQRIAMTIVLMAI